MIGFKIIIMLGFLTMAFGFDKCMELVQKERELLEERKKTADLTDPKIVSLLESQKAILDEAAKDILARTEKLKSKVSNNENNNAVINTGEHITQKDAVGKKVKDFAEDNEDFKCKELKKENQGCLDESGACSESILRSIDTSSRQFFILVLCVLIMECLRRIHDVLEKEERKKKEMERRVIVAEN